MLGSFTLDNCRCTRCVTLRPFLLASTTDEYVYDLASRAVAAPHRLMEDDWYKGYFIPKGSIVIPNIWYIYY